MPDTRPRQSRYGVNSDFSLQAQWHCQLCPPQSLCQAGMQQPHQTSDHTSPAYLQCQAHPFRRVPPHF